MTSTFAVEDMDETLEKMLECGGRVFQYVIFVFWTIFAQYD